MGSTQTGKSQRFFQLVIPIVGQFVKLPMREAINSPTYRKLERQDHDFDKLRIDPRVTALLKKIGLEE